MNTPHRLGFYHTFLANEEIPSEEWQGIRVSGIDEPVFGIEVFVEYRLFNLKTNDEVLFNDTEYMPFNRYMQVEVNEDGIVFHPNETLLHELGYRVEYHVSEYYTIVNGEYTFTAGPHEGLTIEMSEPKPITSAQFHDILFEHLDLFINTENNPSQSTAYKRVEVKGVAM